MSLKFLTTASYILKNQYLRYIACKFFVFWGNAHRIMQGTYFLNISEIDEVIFVFPLWVKGDSILSVISMYVLDTGSLVYRITLCEQMHQSQTPKALERCFLRTGILNTNSRINECWSLWTHLKYRSLPGIFHSCLPTGLIGSPKDWRTRTQVLGVCKSSIVP